MSDCVFCAIINDPERQMPGIGGTIAVWPDAIAIEPIDPVAERHTLVIPRVHVIDFVAWPLVTAVTMARAAELAQTMRIFPANLITSAGTAATQSVFHLHVHVIPRKDNDGLALPWYSGKRSNR